MQASQDSEQAAKQKAAAKEAALLECKIRLLLQDKDLLGKVVTDTLGNIEKKQARTYEELQAEQMEAEEVCTIAQLSYLLSQTAHVSRLMQFSMLCSEGSRYTRSHPCLYEVCFSHCPCLTARHKAVVKPYLRPVCEQHAQSSRCVIYASPHLGQHQV